MALFLRSIMTLIVLLNISVAARAQKLPEGTYHTNRERSYDILHYKADIRFDFEQKQVFGTSTIRIVPLRRINSFSLDALHLNVESVTAKDMDVALAFRYDDPVGGGLSISLPQAQGPADTLTVVVTYHCQPKAGMYFRRDADNPQLSYVTTYGENGLHANWLPIYNDVNDKFSSEMLVTVPAPYTVISNGKLIETLSQPDGQRTFHWLQNLPHSNYLIALYVGNFEKGDLAPASGTIPLSYWVPAGRLQEGAYTFRNTTRMVEFFSNKLGYKYPWDKYDQIAVPDYAIGAMEHTGVTGHRANILRDQQAPSDFDPILDGYSTNWTAEAIIAHELAHHWFGDNLTCRNLSHIWLNESFASYMMMLWDEETLGTNQLLFDVQLAKDHYIEYVRSQQIIRPLQYHYFDDANSIYNEQHTYFKGAAVLHMLRSVLGDEPFFRALSYYLRKNEFANVESHDFKIAIEEATGENLEWFFQDWITGAGHPQFAASYRYLPEYQRIDLAVRQVQPIVEGQGVFRLPVNITIATSGRTWHERVWIEDDDEHFLLVSDEKPLMVSFDGAGDLVAEVRFPKTLEELIHQAKHDALPGRIWAIRELASSYPRHPQTLSALSALVAASDFWAVRAEAALQLGAVGATAAERALGQPLKSGDYRVRKAVVLALSRLATPSAEQKLKEVITHDAQNDVVAAAIVALARANPKTDAGFIQQQFLRRSWNDEIVVACLRAFGELKRPDLIAALKKYTGELHNQYVREAALLAWEACAPGDEELHRTLISLVRSPVYALQQASIRTLGRLQVSAAAAVLEEIRTQAVDDNLTVAAAGALKEIARLQE